MDKTSEQITKMLRDKKRVRKVYEKAIPAACTWVYNLYIYYEKLDKACQ